MRSGIVMMLRILVVFVTLCQLYQVSKAEHVIDRDFILTDEQWDALHKASDATERKVVMESLAWGGGIIPYMISPELEHIRPTIEQGIALWEEVTCMQFPREEDEQSGAYVIFKNLGEGACYSYFGHIPELAVVGQNISIGDGCEAPEIVAHEIGHAMGLAHEQHRPDRDQYITVHYQNMGNDSIEQFLSPLTIDTFGVPYDYTSIMHYGIDAFTITGGLTIVPKDHTMEIFMGNAKRPSFADIYTVNTMYGCQDLCADSDLQCENGGFVTFSTESNGCRCICPDGFSGPTCEKQVIPYFCGAFIDQPGGDITSGNFPYLSNEEFICGFHIQAPDPNQKVAVRFDSFFMENRLPNGYCYFDYLRVRVGDLDGDDPGQLYCGDELFNMEIHSDTNQMGLYFKGRGAYKVHIEFV